MLYGLPEALQFGRHKFKAVQENKTVHPDIMKSVMQAGALQGNQATLTWFQNRFETSESEHDRMNVLTALGCFRDPDLIRKAMDYTLENVPDRNKFIPVTVLSSNPHAISDLWGWYKESLQRLETFHPLLYERVIASITPLGGLYAADEVTAFFEAYVRQSPQFKEVVALSLEKLEINQGMRERNS
jgi:tricorn protease interacting factor F2/3